MSSEMKVRTPDAESYCYPDVIIICGKAEYEDERQDVLLNPVVIIEILSPSTEAWDRGGKFERYQTIPSLREYLLVAQDKARIEKYTVEGKRWVLDTCSGADDTLRIESASIEIPLSEIYERVEFGESTRPTGGLR